jgi:hypothetical protein
MAAPSSSTYTGWFDDRENSRLDYYYRGTTVGHMNGTTFVLAAGVGMTVTDTGLTVTSGGLTVTAGGLTVTADGLTVTAGGATVTAGDLVVTAGDAQVLAETLYMGAATAFAVTEPTSAVILKSGTAPSGAIVTSSGIYSNDTVLRKVIADGTLSNVG